MSYHPVTEKITLLLRESGVPPFGNIFNLAVYADEQVFDNEKMIFNAGDRSFSIGMYSKDYEALVVPKRGTIV